MSYLIPIKNLSLAEQERRRMQAVMSGRQAMVDHRIVTGGDPAKVVVDRDADYPFDFVPAATRAGLSGWLTQPLLAAATNYSLFADNTGAALTPQVPNNNVWVFYGVHVLTLNDPITQLFFATGVSAIRKAAFDLEKLYDQETCDGYFTQPVVYGPQEIVTVQVRSRIATGVGCRVVLDTLIFEPIQTTQA